MILTAITFVVMLCVLVVVHEYGHFLFARICGIRVKEFAIGFGPKLFTWLRKKDTDFTVRLYPLGGFVSMAGESLEEIDEEDGFQSQPAWKRFLVVFAGPLFSFLFAVVIFISIGYLFGFPSGKNSNKIQMVMPQTKAAQLGLRSGDEIISINGIPSVEGSYIKEIHSNPDKELSIKIKREGKIITKVGAPDLMVRFAGVNCKTNPKHIGVLIDSISSGSVFAKKGVTENDVLIAINNIDINSTKELENFLTTTKSKELSIVINSGGNLKTINIDYEPYYYKVGNADLYFPEKIFVVEKSTPGFPVKTNQELISINGVKVATYKTFDRLIKKPIRTIQVKEDNKIINIDIRQPLTVKPVEFVAVGAFGFVPAPNLIKTNIKDSVVTGSRYIVKMLGELFRVLTSKEIKNNVGGPIAIVSATNSAVNTGMFSIIILMGGLSLSLAILNLLPIPVLDGGHIFIIFLEAIKRKRFTKEQLVIIQSIGLFIIICIFVTVMYSDISKLILGTMPK